MNHIRLSLNGLWPVVVLLATALLSGCSSVNRVNPGEAATTNAVPRFEPQPSRLNPSSYSVLGRTYHVLGSNDGYDAQGVASWYGPNFQSKPTSSGERYNMYAMTAAHKTLRIPSYVLVTNMENGKQVVVRVNDRGPFVSNRIIDLSYAAAKKIGMIGRGTAMVDVRSITPDSPIPTSQTIVSGAPTLPAEPVASAPAISAAASLPHAVWGQDVFIQVGAFGEMGHVISVQQRLAQAGITAVSVTPFGALNRVRVGPVASLADYDRLMDQLRTIGFDNAQMVVEQ
ncbi:septal ring lytic transglycosylase RlpA family protein [Halothiobacillus neapolitanus]|uniref:Endolytic peptidoglycan transglycosylase RlpA n=1 Tax=Halothiobacillus neapolitanus (strain ATCC 23641 / DSM 15147 / CIP 104769 / NCIMB 8539 / c2) TaxID=555778 RepID=D0L081_HALNC|nr:septal ring lytic transglycosylase RlpA family protein [Halothiobacillus neapolitanus]ACX96104.1 rare lipoprotein A [Halothiobacillus neapolitanus c2]TDN66411.1 rare lipoprotein A [Halothiobacillus neapolitanus]